MDEYEMIEEYESQNAFHVELTDEDYYRHEMADDPSRDEEFVREFNEWYDKTFGEKESK
jgi:hypothetical protein